jgi:adenosylcobinamide-GDP ribazoletransferase
MREALAFLTVLPVGRRDRPPGRGVLVAFPLVGLALGAVWALVARGATALWSPPVAAAAVTVVDVAVTGGLHLDAVADLADGWASRRPPEEALAVMRDPAVGAVGAAVLVATLLARWSLTALLAARGRWGSLVVPPDAGRTAMAGVVSRSRRAAGASVAEPLLGAGWAVAAAVAATAAAASGVAAGVRGVGAVALGTLGAEAAAGWSRRRFGGLAGDVVGAAGIAAEILALALLSTR